MRVTEYQNFATLIAYIAHKMRTELFVPAAAVLVLFAGAAGTWVVAANFL